MFLLFHIMIRHNVDFCKNEPRFMPLIIFHWNCILLLMMEMNKKQFLFHSWKIRAEGRIPLTGNAFCHMSCATFCNMCVLAGWHDPTIVHQNESMLEYLLLSARIITPSFSNSHKKLSPCSAYRYKLGTMELWKSGPT